MEIKDELYKQLTEWTVKEVNAQKKLNSLLPSEELPRIVITHKYMEQFKEAKNELKLATTTIGEILEKIWRLSS
jgi:hypothetical protein